MQQNPHAPIEIIPDEPQYDYVIAPHWILLAPIKHASIRLYLLMRAHVNTQRAKQGDQRVWPSQATLAEMMGLSRADKVLRYLAELEAHGLISTHHTTTASMRDRNVYRIRMTPPAGWNSHLSTSDFHSAKKSVDNSPGSTTKTDKTPGGAVVPKRGLRSPQKGYPVVPKRGKELNELELDESPPPLSSSTPPADVSEAPETEEEIDQIKKKILELPWYGREPTPTQIRDLTLKAKTLLHRGASWSVLRTSLVASTHSGVRDIVGLYFHRLQQIQLEDLATPVPPPRRPQEAESDKKQLFGGADTKPAPVASVRVVDISKGITRKPWCGACQRITRRLITDHGSTWCPTCSSHVQEVSLA